MTTEVPLYVEGWLKNLHTCGMQQQVKADLLEERAVLKFSMGPELMQVDRMKDYTNTVYKAMFREAESQY